MFKSKPFFITITNKYTKQFTKEFLIDSESIDNAIQKTIAIGGIDPLNFDIKDQIAYMEFATPDSANAMTSEMAQEMAQVSEKNSLMETLNI